jgi:hypothetical protein
VGELGRLRGGVLPKEPRLIPKTSSPTANPDTAAPTDTTVPATSSPGTGFFFGPRSPKTSLSA